MGGKSLLKSSMMIEGRIWATRLGILAPGGGTFETPRENHPYRVLGRGRGRSGRRQGPAPVVEGGTRADADPGRCPVQCTSTEYIAGPLSVRRIALHCIWLSPQQALAGWRAGRPAGVAKQERHVWPSFGPRRRAGLGVVTESSRVVFGISLEHPMRSRSGPKVPASLRSSSTSAH